MPKSQPRTCSNRILGDYLVYALRRSPRPLTTTELRQDAPLVAVRGSARPLPPSQETIYRLLRSLARQGTVVTTDNAAHVRAWTAVANPVADRETAALNALFSAPCADTAHRMPKADSCSPRR